MQRVVFTVRVRNKRTNNTTTMMPRNEKNVGSQSSIYIKHIHPFMIISGILMF